MYNPPSLAEVAKSMVNRRDFENLDALSADGSDPPSKMGEIGIHLACNELSPRTRIVFFKKGDLRGAARNFLC